MAYHSTCNRCRQCHACAKKQSKKQKPAQKIVCLNTNDSETICTIQSKGKTGSHSRNSSVGRLSRTNSSHSLHRRQSSASGKSICLDEPRRRTRSQSRSRTSISSEAKLSRRNSSHSLLRGQNSGSKHKSTISRGGVHIRSRVFDMSVTKFSGNCCITTKTASKSHNCDEDHISLSIHVAKKVKQVVNAFQSSTNTRGWTIQVVSPKTVHIPFVKTSDHHHHHQHYHHHHEHIEHKRGIEEPYLSDLIKYTSNTGWYHESSDIPTKLLVALTHFSYAWSGHEFMISKLHASVDRYYKVITIASPGLLSRDMGNYGCEDLGLKGIRNFFYWHTCNRFCKGHSKPVHTDIHYQPSEKTVSTLYH